MKRRHSILVATVFFLICCTYIGTRIWFKAEIDEISNNAQSKFRGDKIEALISALESDKTTLIEKNRAIWALGKLNDTRALFILKSFYSGEACDHQNAVCQREIEKAIDNLEGKSIDIFTFK